MKFGVQHHYNKSSQTCMEDRGMGSICHCKRKGVTDCDKSPLETTAQKCSLAIRWGRGYSMEVSSDKWFGKLPLCISHSASLLPATSYQSWKNNSDSLPYFTICKDLCFLVLVFILPKQCLSVCRFRHWFNKLMVTL